MAPPEMGQSFMLANVRKPTFLHKRLTNQQEIIDEELVGGSVELLSFGELQPITPWEVPDNKWNYKRLENSTFLDIKDHKGMYYLKGLVNLFLKGKWVGFSHWREEGRVGQEYF